MASSKPHYLPKATPPNTITSGVQNGFWRDTNIPSIAENFYEIVLKDSASYNDSLDNTF